MVAVFIKNSPAIPVASSRTLKCLTPVAQCTSKETVAEFDDPSLSAFTNVEVVFHHKVLDHQGGTARARIHSHTICTDGNRPKQTIVQTRIEIVNLIAEIGGLQPHVEVDSSK